MPLGIHDLPQLCCVANFSHSREILVRLIALYKNIPKARHWVYPGFIVTRSSSGQSLPMLLWFVAKFNIAPSPDGLFAFIFCGMRHGSHLIKSLLPCPSRSSRKNHFPGTKPSFKILPYFIGICITRLEKPKNALTTLNHCQPFINTAFTSVLFSAFHYCTNNSHACNLNRRTIGVTENSQEEILPSLRPYKIPLDF